MTSAPGFAVASWLRRRAENVAVVLIATMFACFLLQIAFRYVLNQPLGWTEEVILLCWLWGVLWCAAFVMADEEEIRFDLVHAAVPARVRRIFTVVSSIALIVLFAISLPGAFHYVTFMKREHSAYLHMRFDFVYSIYVIFAVACIVRHALLAWNAVVGRTPPASAPAQESATP